MAGQTLARRVDRLEQRMDALETLPAQVANLATQILQFREDVDRALSAVRQDLGAEMAVQGNQLRHEMREGDEETRRFMRVLHEEVIERLSRIEEGRPRTRRR